MRCAPSGRRWWTIARVQLRSRSQSERRAADRTAILRRSRSEVRSVFDKCFAGVAARRTRRTRRARSPQTLFSTAAHDAPRPLVLGGQPRRAAHAPQNGPIISKGNGQKSSVALTAQNTSSASCAAAASAAVGSPTRSERASRASGPAVDTRLRRRDERMSSREICKYYLHGACRNGASCRFSHEMSAPKSTVCTYYLAGNCAYGDKCRYDHVRPKVRAPIERRARSDTARGVPRPPPPHPRRFPIAPATVSRRRHRLSLGVSAHPRLSDLPFSRSGSAASLFFALSLTRNLHPPKRRTPAPRAVPPAAPRGRVSRARLVRPP